VPGQPSSASAARQGALPRCSAPPGPRVAPMWQPMWQPTCRKNPLFRGPATGPAQRPAQRFPAAPQKPGVPHPTVQLKIVWAPSAGRATVVPQRLHQAQLPANACSPRPARALAQAPAGQHPAGLAAAAAWACNGAPRRPAPASASKPREYTHQGNRRIVACLALPGRNQCSAQRLEAASQRGPACRLPAGGRQHCWRCCVQRSGASYEPMMALSSRTRAVQSSARGNRLSRPSSAARGLAALRPGRGGMLRLARARPVTLC
jgi:hypothetical protein